MTNGFGSNTETSSCISNDFWVKTLHCLPLLIVLLITLVGVVCVQVLPVYHYLDVLVSYLEHHKLMGCALMVAIYLVVIIVGAPRALMGLTLGWIYGLWIALALDLFSLAIGAALIHGITQYLCSAEYKSRLRRAYPTLAGLEAAISHHSWRTLIVFNLAPALPYSLNCFILSAMSVSLPALLLTGVLCNLPYSLAYILIGCSATTMLQADMPWWQILIVVLSGCVALGFAIWLYKVAKRFQAECEQQLNEEHDDSLNLSVETSPLLDERLLVDF